MVLVLCMALAALAGCTNDDPKESTPITTPIVTPEQTPEQTPEETPVVTPEETPVVTPEETPVVTPEETPVVTPEETPEETPPETPAPPQHNISYDLDGGIDGGNPLEYDPAEALTLIVPIKPGYDFAGWTGTGVDTPTKVVTIPAGTDGNLSFKANWTENTEFSFTIDNTTADILGKIFFGGTKAAFIVNEENTFENRNNLDGIKDENDKTIKEKMPSINASNELTLRELRDYFAKKEQTVDIVRDVNLTAESGYGFLFYFGISDCAPVEEFVSTLNYSQYGIAVNEDSLCFIAWTEASNEAAGKILYEIIDHVVKGGSFSDFVGARYVSTVEGTVGADLPALPGLDGGTDVGEGAYQVFSLDSTKEIYDAYLAALAEAGYTFYTSNVMNKTHTATYYNDNEVVNVVFAGGDPEGTLGVDADRSLRVVVDPKAITALPSLEKPDDADADVTVTSVTQLWDTNLCIVFQLSNGHFVILDSGNNGKQKVISDFLRKMAPDGKPVVEAWFFSHFHQDHIGGFVEYMGISSLNRYVTVESVIYNFPSERTYMTAYKSSTDMSNMKIWYEKRIPALREKGTTIYQARTGQKYYFGNAEIEILWTFEDLTPFNIYTDSTNRTDIGFRVTIEGQTFMMTGDSTEEQFRIADARYGDYLKSDFVQLAHHGSGNGLGTHNFYKTVNAPIVFHPRIQELSSTTYKIGPNEKWAIDNAQLVIRSGNYHTATLKLPFKIGDEIISDREPDNELG